MKNFKFGLGAGADWFLNSYFAITRTIRRRSQDENILHHFGLKVADFKSNVIFSCPILPLVKHGN